MVSPESRYGDVAVGFMLRQAVVWNPIEIFDLGLKKTLCYRVFAERGYAGFYYHKI